MKANWSRENIVIADERWPETFLNHKSKNKYMSKIAKEIEFLPRTLWFDQYFPL